MLLVLVEGTSDVPILRVILERRFGLQEDHDFRIFPHGGLGRIPKNPAATPPPHRRQLLDQLPAKLRGFERSYGTHLKWYVVLVVVDNDGRNCFQFKADLVSLAQNVSPRPKMVLFRIAMQELEAWYLADRDAVKAAYPDADLARLPTRPEAVTDAAERFASILGRPGMLSKTAWAEAIAPHLALHPPVAASLQALIAGIGRELGLP